MMKETQNIGKNILNTGECSTHLVIYTDLRCTRGPSQYASDAGFESLLRDLSPGSSPFRPLQFPTLQEIHLKCMAADQITDYAKHVKRKKRIQILAYSTLIGLEWLE